MNTPDTCPTCGSNNRSIRQRLWKSPGDFEHCADSWHDTTPSDREQEAEYATGGIYEPTPESVASIAAVLNATACCNPAPATPTPEPRDEVREALDWLETYASVGGTSQVVDVAVQCSATVSRRLSELEAETKSWHETADGNATRSMEWMDRAKAAETLTAKLREALKAGDELAAGIERVKVAKTALMRLPIPGASSEAIISATTELLEAEKAIPHLADAYRKVRKEAGDE